MPIQTIKDIVKECGDPIRSALYLCEWSLVYEFGECENTNASGQINSNESYRTATIRLDPAMLRDRGEVCEVLLHEMLHLVIADLDAPIDAAGKALEPLGTATAQMLRAAYHHAVERVVGNLERVLTIGFRLSGEEIADGGKYRKKGWISK